MAAARGRYVCQSQSLNIFMRDVTPLKLSSMHFHAWKSGLKTGLYYLRTKAPAKAVQVTLDPKLAREEAELMREFNNNAASKSSSAASLATVSAPGGPAGPMAMAAAAGSSASSTLTAEQAYALRQAKQAEADKRQEAADALEENSCKGGGCTA
jgi:ribonucleoside-diphosphate reductase subunit M1